LFRVNDAGRLIALSFSGAGNWVDAKVIDGVANGMATAGQALSKAARRIQTGITEQYIAVLAAGILVILIALLLFSGVNLA
jgi:hypothetical protein